MILFGDNVSIRSAIEFDDNVEFCIFQFCDLIDQWICLCVFADKKDLTKRELEGDFEG